MPQTGQTKQFILKGLWNWQRSGRNQVGDCDGTAEQDCLLMLISFLSVFKWFLLTFSM